MQYQVTSASNGRVKRLVRLKDRKHRDAERVFVVEEPRIIERAIASGHQPREIYTSSETRTRDIADGVEAFTLSEVAIDKASYRKHSTGVIAVFGYLDSALDAVPVGEKPLILIAEGLEKPGNLGALLRIGDAAGVDGVIVVDGTADPFNPNVVRASTGAIFTVPIGLSDNVPEVSQWLKSHDIESFAAVPNADDSLWVSDLSGRVAIWVGAEADGLTSTARRAIHREISIPMAGSADSLNASVAAAVITFEALRQRS